ncbi:MAG: hypothetical protein R2909_00265 [Gemmatimonadales bacterium]
MSGIRRCTPSPWSTAASPTEFREESTTFYGNVGEYMVDAAIRGDLRAGQRTERGKYLNVWQWLNGSWKIKSNMGNTGRPPWW